MAAGTRSSATRTAPTSTRYYTCRRRHSIGRCPAPARIRADEIEPLVEQVFRERFLTDRIAEPSVSTDELDAALAAQAQADLHAFLTSPATDEMRRALGDEWGEEGQRTRLNRVVEAREAVTKGAQRHARRCPPCGSGRDVAESGCRGTMQLPSRRP